MTEYTISGEGAIAAVTANTTFHAYDADSTLRTKKATAAQIATYLPTTPGAAASTSPMLDAEQYVIQATDSAADNNSGLDSSSAAAVFTSGNGAITLSNSGVYFFEACYNITNTGTTSHTWATLFGGTATFATGTSYQVFGNSGTTANTPASGGLSGFFQGTSLSTAVVCTAASTSATEQVAIQLYGVIVVGSSGGGTLIPQMKASARPGASGTPGVVHKAGSFFRIWQVPTLGTNGNWS